MPRAVKHAPFVQYHAPIVWTTLELTIHADGTWSYDEDTVLQILGRDEPFHHTDRNRMRKIAEPTPNGLMRAQA